jgi:MFS family permease
MERRIASTGAAGGVIVVAWLATSIFYFYQYVLRSAPAVMMPQLSDALGLSTAGLATLVGLFYYAYAPFSLVAGVAMDQLGARAVVPLGCAIVAAGALLFATGDPNIAAIGRLLQGMGGVFALIGAAYIATTNFPASRAATLIGVTQMFGMAGGSAGQFLVGPAIAGGLSWNGFWIAMGVAGAIIAVLLFLIMPKSPAASRPNWMSAAASAIWAVASNPQSILCGLISGLFFIPTTIFDMTWGVRFLQEAHDMPYGMAVLRSASVPFGWIIGCPLVGMLSDRMGRRKPVIVGSGLLLAACLALILYGPAGVFPPFVLGLVTGIASGAAMLPYTVIKEANRPEHSGTATGVVNFINFSFSALLGPVFGGLLLRASSGGPRELEHYQAAFSPLLYGVALAVLLTLLLKETGTRAAAAPPVTASPARP